MMNFFLPDLIGQYTLNASGFKFSIKHSLLIWCLFLICNSIFGQVTIFSETFETATGSENLTNPAYLGWQTGQFATTPPTNNNYFWIFDNTRCNVITGSYSMAVSDNNPVTTGTRPEYRTNRVASTLVYYNTPINASNYTNLTLDFNWICEGEPGFDYGTVLYSLDGATWAALPGFYEGQSTVQNVTNLDLSVVDGQSFYLGFGWDNDNSAGAFPGFIIDDIFVKGILQTPCTTPNQPTALTLVPTGNSINGSFTAAAPVPSGYLVVVSTSATAPSPVNGTPYAIGSTIGAGYTVVDNDANTTFTAVGLNPSTTYYLYIFAYNSNCLGGPQYSTGSLSGSTTTTNSTYCSPTTSNTRSFKYINDVQFIGTLNDVSNFGNSYFNPNPATCSITGTSSGYQDWTCRPNSIQAQGEGVNIYVGSSTGRGRYKAWVDWNKDGVFDNNPANGELVYDTGGILTTTTTFGFVIPANQPIGDYRIRIRFHGATNNAGAELGGPYNFTDCQNFGSGGGVRHYGEAEDYLFTVIQSCPAKITSVTDGFTCGPGSVTLQATSVGATQYRWYTSQTGGGPVAITATGTWTPIISTTTTYWVTAYDGSCESLIRTKIVATLNPITELTITPEFPTVCGPDEIIEISATGDTELAYLIDEDFEDLTQPTGVFSVINLINNGAATDALTQWQKRTSPFVANQLVWKPAMSSGIAGNHFLSATSDVAPATGQVYTSLESPEFDTSTFTDLTLNFDMYFSKYLTGLDPDYILIYASTDGGFTWALVQAYTDDIGYGTNFSNLTIDMTAYIDEPNLKISIDYYAIWADGVAVDNIQLFGSRPLSPSFTWTGTVDAYTSATALPGQEYTPGTPIGTVYVKPTLAQLELANFTFTANATLSNGCTVSKDITITNNTKIWQGLDPNWNAANNWKPSGAPTSANCVIIPSSPNGAEIDGVTDANAYNLTVLNGGVLTAIPGATITVQDYVNVNMGGTFELQSQDGAIDGTSSSLSASLIQVNDISNTGDIIFKRATYVRTQDYVYWSSPTQNYSLTNIGSTINRFKWIPTVASNTPTGFGEWEQTGENMIAGKGYIVRGPNGNGNTASIPKWNTVTFTGTPNNGTISLPILRGTYSTPGTIGNPNPDFGDITENDDNWNLVGNPYPSTLDTDAFLTLNASANDRITGTVWLWQHGIQIRPGNNPFFGDFLLNYDEADYLEYNLTGSTGGFNGYIGSGQGFFVLMDDASPSGTSLEFNNTMRGSSFDNDAQFFRQNNQSSEFVQERHRIWLDFVNPANQVSTILIGYLNRATSGYDKLYDAPLITGSTKKIFMPNDAQDRNFVIQGKGLPFNETDSVPISVIINESGSHAIAVQQYDGLFENQNIFLEDLELNIIHDIKQSPYFFTASSSGTINNRFILRYDNPTLGLNSLQNESVNIISVNNEIKVTSVNSTINSVIVYDVLGRVLTDHKNINALEFNLKLPNLTKGTLIVKATLNNGRQKIKKVIY